jgi:hypothetical protein
LPPSVPRRAAQTTAILGPAARAPRPRWYRRIHWPEPRYLALIVVGLLVVGGGAAYGVSELLSEEEASTPATRAGGGSEGGAETPRAAAPVNPSTVTVSVLNGTSVGGLAAQIGDKVEVKGFQLGNVTNAAERAEEQAESVALYVPGARREAVAVARALGIGQTEEADQQSRSLAGNASVIVIVGLDQTQ